MPRPPFAYSRAETQVRVLERYEAGWTDGALEAEPGFPSRQTLYRWAKADPGFAARLTWARAWRRGVQVEGRAQIVAFDAGLAEAFLRQVRCGAAVRDLVRRPEWPSRERLHGWRPRRGWRGGCATRPRPGPMTKTWPTG